VRAVIGSTNFKFKRITVPSRPLRTSVRCFLCSTRLRLASSSIMAVFTVGNENVGVCCDDCLDPASREHVVRARQAQRKGARA